MRAGSHVRSHRAESRILDAGGGHVAGTHSGILGLLDQVLDWVTQNVDAQRTVKSLGASRPGGAGCSRVGHVVDGAIAIDRMEKKILVAAIAPTAPALATFLITDIYYLPLRVVAVGLCQRNRSVT